MTAAISLKQTLSEWAQAMLALHPIVVVLDTSGLSQDADILRVLIADCGGHIFYDQIVQPMRTGNPNTLYTGISEEQLLAAPTLADCWDDIQCYLKGNLLLAFNFEWLVARLRENAAHYGLPIVPVGGACIKQRAQGYFQTPHLSLRNACEKAGLYLPDPAFAIDRAQAQGKLLQAMSENRRVADPPTITADTELDELEDHPF